MTQRSWDLGLPLPLLVYKVTTVGGATLMISDRRDRELVGLAYTYSVLNFSTILGPNSHDLDTVLRFNLLETSELPMLLQSHTTICINLRV